MKTNKSFATCSNGLYEPMTEMTAEWFDGTTKCASTSELINAYRSTKSAKKKSQLPVCCFQASFGLSINKVGVEGTWRESTASHLTGLAVIDLDHVENPLEIVDCILGREDFSELGILLIYITPSGQGIKIVFIARPEWGNLMDNQYEMAQLLGVLAVVDSGCKDAARASFVPKFDDVKFLDESLFTYSNPAYDEYPVVGISWDQANAFCAWRTNFLMKGLGGYAKQIQRYRLPTEVEWEYAARGKEGNPFPWTSLEVKSDKGCYYANFKPDRGNYTKDGSLITSKCGIFSANSNGLYDMAGNVAEWTSTVFTEAGVESMSDMNPDLKYNAAKEDPYRLKKKSVRGGSWKDPESMIRSAWRSYEYQNQPRCYVGFRCVRTMVNDRSNAGAQKGGKASNKGGGGGKSSGAPTVSTRKTRR